MKRIKARDTVLLSILILVITSDLNAWNSRWSAHLNSEDYNTAELRHNHLAAKAHNWITLKALEKLREAGRSPFPLLAEYEVGASIPEGRDDAFTAFELLSYGLFYADHVWVGPPENHETRINVVGDEIEGYLFDYDCDGLDAVVEVKWMGDYNWDDSPRYNTHLRAYYRRETPLKKREYAYGADNLYHYSNDKDVYFEYTSGPVDDETAFETSTIGAANYSSILYKMGKDFWPGWEGRTANMSKMVFFQKDDFTHPDIPYTVNTSGDTGNITIDGPGTGAQPRAQFPSFFAGGNPFVCVPPANLPTDSIDICEVTRKPTWPLWAVDFDYAVDHPDVFKDEDLVYGGSEFNKSKRAGLIYLGWALHMIQELTNPDHAKNRTGNAHSECEKLVDSWWIEPHWVMNPDGELVWVDRANDWADSDAELAAWVADFSTKNYSEICSGIGLEDNVNDNLLASLLEDVRAYAVSKHGAFHGEDESEPSIATTEDLMRKAIQISMQYIYCFPSEMDYRPAASKSDTDFLWLSHRAIVAQKVKISEGSSRNLSATEKIVLKPGFSAVEGSHVRMYIESGTGLVPPALANNDNDKKDSDEASAMADNNWEYVLDIIAPNGEINPRKARAFVRAQIELEKIRRGTGSSWTEDTRIVDAYPIYLPGSLDYSYYEFKVMTGDSDAGYILVNIDETDLIVPQASEVGLTFTEEFQKATGRTDLYLERHNWFTHIAKDSSGEIVAASGLYGSSRTPVLKEAFSTTSLRRLEELDEYNMNRAEVNFVAPYRDVREIASSYLKPGNAEKILPDVDRDSDLNSVLDEMRATIAEKSDVEIDEAVLGAYKHLDVMKKQNATNNGARLGEEAGGVAVLHATPAWDYEVGVEVGSSNWICPVGCGPTALGIVFAYWSEWRGRDQLFGGHDLWDNWTKKDCQWEYGEQDGGWVPDWDFLNSEGYDYLIYYNLVQLAIYVETYYDAENPDNDGDCDFGMTHTYKMDNADDWAEDNSDYQVSVVQIDYGYDPDDGDYYNKIKSELLADRPVVRLVAWNTTHYWGKHYVVITGAYWEAGQNKRYRINADSGGGDGDYHYLAEYHMHDIFTIDVKCPEGWYDCGHKCAEDSSECDDMEIKWVVVEENDGPKKDGKFIRKSKGTIKSAPNYDFIAEDDAEIELVAEDQITLNPGLHIKPGALFHAYIDDVSCNPYEEVCGNGCCTVDSTCCFHPDDSSLTECCAPGWGCHTGTYNGQKWVSCCPTYDVPDWDTACEDGTCCSQGRECCDSNSGGFYCDDECPEESPI